MDPVSTNVSSSTQSTSTTNSAAAITSDFETFLRMLTTQLENQDPLEPVGSQELAVQLATFSGVEQQTRTNSLLEGLGTQMGLMNLSQLASWVGMEALAPTDIYFDGSPLELKPSIPALAESAELVVSRPDGTEVQRLALDLAAETVSWAGVGANGTPLPTGKYSITVEARAQGEDLATASVQAYQEIQEVKSVNGATILVTNGAIEIPAASVTSLRKPL